MAKSARSSAKKANKRALKEKVFGPVEDARIERLSAKLQEVITKRKQEVQMTDAAEASSTGEADAQNIEQTEDVMELDEDMTRSKGRRMRRSKITKKHNSRHAIVFPRFRKRQSEKGKRKG